MNVKTNPSGLVLRAVSIFAAAFLAASVGFAQQPTVLTSGLKNPSKILLTDRGNLLVAEAGNGPNTGRVSIVDRVTGARRTLIDNLPSGLAAPNGDPDGVTGLAVSGMTLFLSTGTGDATLAGPNGTEIPNPSPSSPLFSSVLQLDLNRFLDNTDGGFALTAANQTAIKNGQPVLLTAASGETASIRLFADFPDYVQDPNTGVRPSHPYGLFLSAHNLYVVDAAMNSLRRVDLATQNVFTVATFPPLSNPTSVGPPVMDAVPDSIRLYGNRLLVPFLPGFPFPPGFSEVRLVDPATGIHQTYLPSLTSAIDVLPVASIGPEQFLVLEFSTDMLANKPGQLLLVAAFGLPGLTQKIITTNLVAPTNMAFDPRTSEVFVSQLANGQIVRIDASAFVPPISTVSGIIPVAAATTGAGGINYKTFVQLNNPYSSPISGTILFRGQTTTASGPTLDYTLFPFQTLDIPDILGSMGQTGLGSLDVVATTGSAPVAAVSVYADNGPVEAGAREELVPTADALFPGQGGTLLPPSNLQRYRFNIGIRTLGTGAFLNVTVRDRSGTIRRSFSATYPANYFFQLSAGDFLGVTPQPGDSIRFTLNSGQAIVYGATADSLTPETEIALASRTID